MKIESNNFDDENCLENSLKLKSRVDNSLNEIGACHFHTNWEKSKPEM